MRTPIRKLSRRKFIKSLTTFGMVSLLLPQTDLLASEFEGSWHELVRPLMGAFVSIAIYHENPKVAQDTIISCFEFLEANIKKISDWDLESDTTRLNIERKIKLNKNDPLHSLITSSSKINHTTKGMFQPLSYQMNLLWRRAKETSSIPDHLDIKNELNRIENSSIQISPTLISLIGHAGFDFGGIGKGYIADLGCHHLKSHGISFARIDCGGDMRFIGRTQWTVEVEDPRSENMLTTINKYGEFAIATSGDYRNCWFVNGTRYHHLINPNDGQPSRLSQQVTIINPSATIADALATAVFFLKPEIGLKFIKQIPNTEAIIVDHRHQVHSTFRI